MAVLTKITGPGAYATAPVAVAFTASTPAGDTVVLTGRDILLIRNTGAGARTVTITSQTDTFGRTGHVTAFSLPAGTFAIFGPIPTLGWADSSGNLNLASEHAEIQYAVVTLHSP